MSWRVNERSYKKFFDRMVENIFIKRTLEKVKIKEEAFTPIKDVINPNRLPLPTKMTDLKILYLDFENEYRRNAGELLGLNITFETADNNSLGRYVQRNLGEYDIIIGTNTYTKNLLSMNKESTEQCKDTGRELTVLTTFEGSYWGSDDELGGEIRLDYTYGGNLAPDSECHHIAARVLAKNLDIEEENENRKKYLQNETAKLRGIIGAAIHFYNQALLSSKGKGIEDINFKSAEELEQEYAAAYKMQEEQRIALWEPILKLDNLTATVKQYISYKKKGLISQNPVDLEIYNRPEGIRVVNLYQGKPMCAITFSKKREQGNKRIFIIESLTKNGNLSASVNIGFDASEDKKFENMPKRPNEKQQKALDSIQKKVDYALKPLIEEARKQEKVLKSQNKRTLERKPKIYKY